MDIPTPAGKTHGKLFIYKKGEVNTHYRLDYGPVKGGGKAFHEHTSGLNQVKGFQTVEHLPTLRASALGGSLNLLKWGGRATFFVGMAASAIEVYQAENKARQTVIEVTGMAGAIGAGVVGAKLGVGAGTSIGAFAAGGGAAPGAIIGGAIGGIGFGIGGYYAGAKVAAIAYDWTFSPPQSEEWVICGEAD